MKTLLQKIRLFTILSFMVNLFFISVAYGQTTIVSDGLNNSSSHFTLNGGSYYSGNSSSSDRPASSPFFSEGTHGRGVSNNTATLTSTNNINTSAYSDIKLSFRLAAFSIGSSSNGLDANDDVTVAISTNGGSNYTTILTVAGSNNDNSYWSYSGGTGIASTTYPTTATFRPSNSGNRTTDGYSTLVINSLPAISNLRIRITLDNSSTSERWVVDDFKITGCQNAIAGTDQVKCNNGSFTLAGNTATAGSGTWSLVSGSATIATPSSATSGVTNVPVGTSATLRWTITNGTCSTSDDVVLTNSTAPNAPGVISTSSNVCASTSGNTYSIAAVSGATSYNWSVTGTGWSIPVASSTTSVNVNIGTGIGTVSVTATNSCGTSSSTTTGNITPNTVPATPAAITQPTNICANSTGTFSIAVVSGATSYTWAETGSGWSISGPNNATSVNVNIGTSTATVTVKANNACGSSSNQTTGNMTPTTTPTPGTITQPATKCANSQNNVFSISPVSGANSYTWSVTGTGWSIPVASTTTSVNVTVGTGVGTVSVTQTNACGTSSASSTGNITPTTIPTVSYNPNSVIFCLSQYDSHSPTISGSPTSFTINPSLPNGLTFNTSNGTISGTASNPSATADYTVTATNPCGSAQTVINIAINSNSLQTVPGERCEAGIVNLVANPSGCFNSTLKWYSLLTGGSSLATGSNYSPTVTNTTDFYVEEQFEAGETTIGISSGSNTGRGLVFNLNEPITLNSVQIRSLFGSGSITISLTDSSNNPVIGAPDVTISPTNSFTTNATIALNWSIPAGSGYKILYKTGSRTLLKTTSYTFPTSLGVGSITGNVDSSGSNIYNYFYNWNISRARVAVAATVNSKITPTFNTVPAICIGDILTALPTTSNNSFSGTWSPALNNSATTTYTFTPNVGQCANSTTLDITVNSKITPTFNAVPAICSGAILSALPITSNNLFTGTWLPALSNTATTTYTFTPNIGQCANTATLEIVVNNCAEATLPVVDSYVYCPIVRYAQNYVWEATTLDENGNPTGEVQFIETPLRQFKISWLTNFLYNTQYSIRVAATVNNVLGSYSAPMFIKTPNPPSNINDVCGTTIASMNTQIFSTIVKYTPGYKYTLTNLASPFDSHSVEYELRVFKLNQMSGLIAGATYNIIVEVKNLNGAYLPSVSSPCQITIPSGTGRFESSSTENISVTNFDANSFPNPFTNDFSIHLTSADKDNVQISVYDMIGRMVEQKSLLINDLENIKFGNHYQSGIYNIIVSQGTNSKSIRMIKK